MERCTNRILLIDDNPAIHQDFRKILAGAAAADTELSHSEAALFGEIATTPAPHQSFQIDSAFQGAEGLASLRSAQQEKRPYALAFIDMRMPPGWDGAETALQLWAADPHLQIVICTAYADYTWDGIVAKLGHADQLVILKKPFDPIEVLQLADSLTRRWELGQQVDQQTRALTRDVEERKRDVQSLTAQLTAARQQLSVSSHIEKAQMTTKVRRRAALEESLRHALDANEFTVHYQPLIDIATRRLVSLEALVRWQHPTKGLVAPGIFIPAAEESGLILPIGEFVLNTVCRQMVTWQLENVPVVPVAVNVSAVQFKHQNLCATVRGILKDTGMSPRLLYLELTESTLMEDPEHFIEELQCLRKDGIRIQIDDFGTGYSSLSYLTNLPIDTLKIDRSFISRINSSVADEAIVSAILAMARSLHLRVVAEGVETVEQLDALGRHGCEIAQGFYFSRPVPAEDIRKLLLDLAHRPSFTETVRHELIASQSFGKAANS